MKNLEGAGLGGPVNSKSGNGTTSAATPDPKQVLDDEELVKKFKAF